MLGLANLNKTDLQDLRSVLPVPLSLTGAITFMAAIEILVVILCPGLVGQQYRLVSRLGIGLGGLGGRARPTMTSLGGS